MFWSKVCSLLLIGIGKNLEDIHKEEEFFYLRYNLYSLFHPDKIYIEMNKVYSQLTGFGRRKNLLDSRIILLKMIVVFRNLYK
jgi:hypothetical protein